MAEIDYFGCSLIVQNSYKNEILKTVVKGYDKKLMWISINEYFDKNEIDEPLNLLIMTEEGIHEYSGNIQKVAIGSNTLTQIGLFKGRVIENRKAKRYPVNLEAVVENLYFNSLPAKLLNPIKVNITNISSTGVMVSGKANAFRNNSILELKADMNNGINLLFAEVVRIKNNGSNRAEFGCKFVSI